MIPFPPHLAGCIQLSFSYPVNLTTLASALRLSPPLHLLPLPSPPPLPAGRIQLSFSYPVNLTTLASALRLEMHGSNQHITLNVSRCQSPVMPFSPYARLAGRVTQPAAQVREKG